MAGPTHAVHLAVMVRYIQLPDTFSLHVFACLLFALRSSSWFIYIIILYDVWVSYIILPSIIDVDVTKNSEYCKRLSDLIKDVCFS